MSSLSITVTAEVSQLRAQLALASASVRDFAAQERQLASEITRAGGTATEQQRAALEKVSASLLTARTEVAALNAQIGKLAPAAVGGFNAMQHASSGVSRELIVLGHEAMMGRFTRLGGSMMVLAERTNALHAVMGMLTPTIGAIGGAFLAAAAAATYFLLEARRAATAAEEALTQAAFHGNADLTRRDMDALVAQIHRLPKASWDDAKEVAASFTSIRGASTAMARALIDQLDGVAKGMGEKLPEAAKAMAAAMDEPGKEGEAFLQRMHASRDAVDQFDASLAKGDMVNARVVLLQTLADANAKVTHASVSDGSVVAENTRLQRAWLATAGERVKTDKDLAEYAQKLDEASKGIDTEKAAAWARDMAAAHDAMSKGPKEGAPLADVRQQIEAQQAQMALAGKTQAQIAQVEADTWQKRLAIGDLAGKEKLEAEIALDHAIVAAQRDGGQEAISAARERIAQMQAQGKLGTVAMIQAEAATWRGVLSTARLSAEQRQEIERTLNETLAKLHATERDEHMKDLRATTDAAERGSAARIAAAQKEVQFAEVAWGKGSQQAIEAQKRVTQAANEAVAQQRAIAMEWSAWQQRQASEDTAAKRAALQQEVEAGKVSQGAQYATLAQYATQEYQALKASLDRQLEDEKLTAAEKLKIWEQLYDAGIRYQREMADDARKEAQVTQNEWLKALSPIERGFDTLTRDMLSAHMKMGMAAKRAAAEMVVNFVEADAKMLMHWIATQAAKLAAQVAGDQAGVASNAAANASKGASDIGATLASITKNAASAAAAVYNDVAQIPYVGWLLAPPAAALAFAAVEAFGTMIPSAAGGMVVGGDGLIMAHAQEMVLPAHLSSGIQGLIEGGGGAGSAGGASAMAVSPSFNISAVDAKSVVALFNNPNVMRQIARNLSGYMALNPSVRGAY